MSIILPGLVFIAVMVINCGAWAFVATLSIIVCSAAPLEDRSTLAFVLLAVLAGLVCGCLELALGWWAI